MVEWVEEDWIRLEQEENEYTYSALSLYKVSVVPNSKLLCYQIKVPVFITAKTRDFNYKDKVTLNCVIYNLLSCLRKDCKLIYSRRNNSTSNAKGITAHKVKKCVDWLEKEGYIVNRIGVASKNVENRVPSYMEPTDKLKQMWEEEKQRLRAELDYLEQSDAVELRDEEKNKIDYRSNKAIAHMTNVVRSLNKVNEKAIVVDRNGARITNIYCRVFNETFEYGGRFYRADILGIKNSEDNGRLDIKIDGEQVVEVDFSNLHFRIAAALEDIDTDDLPLDVYSGMLEDESNKVDRGIVKIAVNMMFNCKDEGTAQKAIQGEINSLSKESKQKYTLGNARSVMALINETYPDFFDLFCNSNSFGRTLQNHDSHLASDILEIFTEKEIPCLPVHDSFVVQMKYMDMLCDAMGDCFRKRFGVDDPVPVGIKWKDDLGNVIEKKVNV